MRLEFLLEELSAEKALEAILPSLVPAGTEWHLHPHNGRSDLLQQLPAKLRAYAKWLPRDARIVVLCDQHQDDCRRLKEGILNTARAVGMDRRVLARIVVPELESWFLGDPTAVEGAFPRAKAARWAGKRLYRDPDALPNAAQVLDRLVRRFGHSEGYQKVLGGQSIAEKMAPASNRSHSFCVFREGLARFLRREANG